VARDLLNGSIAGAFQIEIAAGVVSTNPRGSVI
jgi:hypothetical protein